MIKNEIYFLRKNKLLLFVILVILLIPSIYACMFLSSMWNPYGEIGKLPVAVVNQDMAVEYNGKLLSVGDNLEKSLENNDSMDFRITDKETAQKGLYDGTYYMVITIPEDFSKNASSMMDKNPQKMRLQYATNPGYNYISSKLSESAIKEIKANIIAEVTTTYTNAVFASITDMGTGFSQAADGTSKLLTGMNSLNEGASVMTEKLNLMADSSIRLQEGSNTLNNGMSDYLDGIGRVDDGLHSLSDGTDKLVSGVSQLQSGSHALLSGVHTMKAQIDNNLTTENVAQIQTASSSLISMNDSIQNLNSAVNGIDLSAVKTRTQGAAVNLQTAGNDLSNASSNLVGAYSATGQESDLGGSAQKVIAAYQTLSGLYQDSSLSDLQRIQIANVMQMLFDPDNQFNQNTAYGDIAGAAVHIKNAGGNIQEAGDTLAGIAQSDLPEQVTTLKASVNQLASASNQLLPASSNVMVSLLSGMQNIQNGLGQGGMFEGMSALNSGLENLNTGITGENGLQSGLLQLKSGSTQLVEKGEILKSGTRSIDDGTTQLSAGARALADGSNDLQAGITTVIDGTSKLDSALNEGSNAVSDIAIADSNIDMFVTPLETQETQITTVENNGHAMAAYMMSVGLWVGCLAFCLMYPLVAYKDKLENGLSWFASKAVIVYPLAIIMGILLYFALHIVNGFNPVQTGNTILVSIITAICFMSIMYFFNALLGKVGSFLMLVFMVLQLSGSAGTYPIEISGRFAEAIHKYVPFTYTVNAFRSAVSGGADIRNELWILIILALVFMLLTVLLFICRAERIKSGKRIFYTWIENHGLA